MGEGGDAVRHGGEIHLFYWETKLNWNILQVLASFTKVGKGRRCTKVCAGTCMSLVQPKACGYLSCSSQQCAGWLGSTRAQDRSVLASTKLERPKAPGAARPYWELGFKGREPAGLQALVPV